MKKEKRKKDRIFLIVIAIVALALIAISIFLPYYLILDSKEIEAKIKVYDKIGVDVSNETLSFGGVMPGGNSMRTVMIESNRDFDMILEVKPLGEMKKFLKNERYIIRKGDGYELTLSASVPAETTLGDYFGKVRFTLYRKII